MIVVKDLNKSFDNSNFMLDNINLNINKGSIYGLVGTNGAGKTTIIKHIVGILKSDTGAVFIDSKDVYENESVKSKLGYIPDDLYFFFGYNLKQMKEYYKGIYQSWSDDRYNEMVAEFNADEDKGLVKLSKGMKKQMAFILTMSTMPEYLILDEPIDGLDPIVRRKVWKYIMSDVADREMSVLVSSHNLKEMESVCDTIGIMSNGKMKIERNLDSLKSDVHKIQLAYQEEMPNVLKMLNILHREKRGSVEVIIVRGDIREISEAIDRTRPVIKDILPLTLEEIFIYEIGGDKNDILI
ncbi:MAG: ABC transporter ATP-binding protein [Anaerovoracaceae bacterium]